MNARCQTIDRKLMSFYLPVILEMSYTTKYNREDTSKDQVPYNFIFTQRTATTKTHIVRTGGTQPTT